MSITMHYQFKARIGEEELLTRLNRIHRKLESFDVKRLGSIVKVDPAHNPTITDVAIEDDLPIPPAVAERLEAAEKDGLDIYRILMCSYMYGGFTEKTWLKFTEPSRQMGLESDLWNVDDYLEQFETPSLQQFNRAMLLFEFANTLLTYGYAFSVTPMNGCESVNIVLATNRNLARPLWLGCGFTTTQYADNFPRAHEMVCQILDMVKEEGLLGKVSDGCKYYKTRNWTTSMAIANRELDFTWMASKVIRAGVDELNKQGAGIETLVDNASTILPPSARPGPRSWGDEIEDQGVED